MMFRRMVAEPTDATYDDPTLIAYIQKYPLADLNAEEPFITEFMNGAQEVHYVNPLWIPTWDFNAAAADVWQEKASALADRIDFDADGGRYSANQRYTNAQKQVAYYRSRRAARSIQVKVWPEIGTKHTSDLTDLDYTNA